MSDSRPFYVIVALALLGLTSVILSNRTAYQHGYYDGVNAGYERGIAGSDLYNALKELDADAH